MKSMENSSGYEQGDRGGSCGPVGHGMGSTPGMSHGGMGGKSGRRTKAVPGMYYSDGMGGMSHKYMDGEGMDGMGSMPMMNSHEFKGGMEGKTPFLKKLMMKKGK
jgi:hypothetical protein